MKRTESTSQAAGRVRCTRARSWFHERNSHLRLTRQRGSNIDEEPRAGHFEPCADATNEAIQIPVSPFSFPATPSPLLPLPCAVFGPGRASPGRRPRPNRGRTARRATPLLRPPPQALRPRDPRRHRHPLSRRSARRGKDAQQPAPRRGPRVTSCLRPRVLRRAAALHAGHTVQSNPSTGGQQSPRSEFIREL